MLQDIHNIREKIKPSFNLVLIFFLLIAIVFSIIQIVNAVAPNPGHNFTEVSGGVATGTLLYGSATDVLSALASVAAGSYLRSGGVSTAPVWSTLTLPNSAATGDILYSSATNVIGNLVDVATGRVLISGGVGVAPLYSTTPTLGAVGTLGTLSLAGNTSGVITIQPQAAAGTYNFNLPIGAGTAGQPLLSGGGVGAAMTFGTLAVGSGGTGLAATADDAVFVGDSASAVTARALPTSCAGSTAKLLYDTTTNAFSCGVDQTGAGGSPTPEATYTMFSTGATMASDAYIMDLFNAVGSGQVIRILEVVAFQRDSAAVTGIRAPIEIRKTSDVGTGGTAITAGKFDSTDTALNANITARTARTAGATLTGGFLGGSRIFTDEAHLGTGAAGSFPWFQSQIPLYVNRGNTSAKRIVLREGQGIACKWGLVVGTAGGLAACGITFQIGAVTATEKPTYSWQSNSAGGASKKMIDIFNASGSAKILKITRINIYARQTAAVVGNITPFEVYRTSAVGTGGTTITADRYDSSDAAVPAQITARDGPTGGATLSGGALFASLLGTEETGDGTYYGYFKKAGFALNTPYVFDGSTTERPLTIREGEGITIQNGPLAATGNVVIIVEGTLE